MEKFSPLKKRKSVAPDGRTFDWRGSFIEDGEIFLELEKAASKERDSLTVEWLNGEQLYHIKEVFGDDVRHFFHERAQDFEKKYPDDPRTTKNRAR